MEALREEVSFSDQVYHGDALDVLKTLPDQSVDAICCDPPAGISFMNMAFDHNRGGRDQWIAWLSSIMTEALRVLKPGGHALVWALPRTSHWTACALEDAGFQIRDKMYHLQGAGFPKSLDVSKQIDKLAGAEREIVGPGKYANRGRANNLPVVGYSDTKNKRLGPSNETVITAPATPEARKYAGFGTALKPSCEEWILCRKPLSEASVAKNVLTHGTGALNIDACRIPGYVSSVPQAKGGTGSIYGFANGEGRSGSMSQPHTNGRWPAQLLLSHTLLCTDDECDVSCPVAVMDAQSGVRKSGSGDKHGRKASTFCASTDWEKFKGTSIGGDQGGASRYFMTFRPMVDETVTSLYNDEKTVEVNHWQKQTHGDTLESQMEDGIESGEKPEVEKSSSNLSIDGYGNKQTDLYQKDSNFTILTTTKQTIDSTISNLLQKNGTTTTTTELEKIIELLMELKSDIVKNVTNTNLLTNSTSDERELITDIVKSAPLEKLESGEPRTENTLTNILNNGQETNDPRPTTTPKDHTKSGIDSSRYFAQFRPTPDDYPPFIYASKASRKERNAGCDALPLGEPPASARSNPAPGRTSALGAPRANHHPTVKSQSLMRYLVRLITPPDGVVLDCFAGSGSTGVAAIAEGFHYILIEQSAEYIDIINARIAHAKGTMFK